MQLLTDIQCFGTISFWSQLVMAKEVTLEQHERYQKVGYRNKYRVLTANGPLLLSIPIVGGRGTRELIREVKIDYSTPWQKQHWRTLESAYNNSPFFLYYREGLEQMITQDKHKFLWDFSWESIQWINRTLKLDLQFHFSKTYERNRAPDDVLDYRSKEKPGAPHLLPYPVYCQVFGNNFVPNLCLLDMLFNLGPSTLKELNTSG